MHAISRKVIYYYSVCT